MVSPDTPDTVPQLLDSDEPTPHRRRWYWRQVRRLRESLFGQWRRESPPGSDDASVEEGVNDLVALALLVAYLRQLGDSDLPTLCSVGRGRLAPTVASIASAFVHASPTASVAATVNPSDFGSVVSVPSSLVNGQWERFVENASRLVYGGRGWPLSLFGDYHQLCVDQSLVSMARRSNEFSARRARGMFYSPAPIVDYLVSTTLSDLLAGRDATQVASLRVLDPSCGCGAFLIASLRYLVRWQTEQLGDRQLATLRSMQLFENVFCGCDIDARALRWATQCLRLSVWEDACVDKQCPALQVQMAARRFNCELACASFLEPTPARESLVPEPVYDAIIGGPPFIRLGGLYRSQPQCLPYYRRRFLSALRGQFDLYMLFIEHALDLLKPGGRLAFSVANSFLRSESGQYLRGYIAANATVEEIVELEDPRTYTDAATQIALLRLRKGAARTGGRYVLVSERGRLRQKLANLAAGRRDSGVAVRHLARDAVASSSWRLSETSDTVWLNAVRAAGVPLGQVLKVEYGPSTARDSILLLRVLDSQDRGEVVVQCRANEVAFRLEREALRTVIRGRQLARYGVSDLRNVYPFPCDEKGRVLPEPVLRTRLPLTFAYLLSHKSALASRKRGKKFPWYCTFVRPQRMKKEGARLMVSRFTSGGGFRLIEDPKLIPHSSVVVLTPLVDTCDLDFIVGVLNSRVFTKYLALTMPRIGAGRFSVRLSLMRRFPLPIVQEDADGVACRRIASYARHSQRVHATREPVDDDKPSIESLIADLYGLNR